MCLEDTGVRAGFRGGECHLDPFRPNDPDRYRVYTPGRVEIEIGDFSSDALTGINTQQLFADLIDRAVPCPQEIIGYRFNKPVVVGRGKRGG